MSELDRKWYVLRAIGGKEKKVKEYIESEISRLEPWRLCYAGSYSY
jgi:transcriptional antiterminator NusG